MPNTAALEIILDARNQAKAALADAQGDLGGLGKIGQAAGSALKFGLAAGAGVAIAGIAGLGAVLTSSVKEAMAAEEVSAQLDAVLRSTAGAAGVTRDAAMGLAESLSQVTRFEDDTILAGENIMLTFTGIGKQVFPDAMTAALNLSTAMGQDLQSSVVQIGKALNDPIAGMTALTRVGVSFTDQQKAQIQAMQESGNVMGAQKLILAELNKEFGGAAVAAGQTFAGQLDILKNNLGNVKESIGTALLPALTTLAQTLGPVLITAAQGFATWATTTLVPLLQTLFTWLATNLPIALQTLSMFWTNTLQPALAAVWSFIQTSVIPILQQVFAWLATNLPIAIQGLANFWTTVLRPALAAVWSFIQTNVIPILQQVFAWLATNLPPAIRGLANFWTTVLQPALAAVWSFIQTSVIPILQQVFAWLATNLPPAIQGLANFWTTVLQPALAAVWSFIQGSVIPILQQVFAWLSENLPPAIQGLANFWTTVLQPALATVWAFLQDNIIPIFVTLLTWLKENIPPALEELRRIWEEVLLPAIQAVWEFISVNIIPLFKALANVWIALLKKELEFLAAIWKTVVKPAIEAVWKFIVENVIPIFETLASKLKGPIGDALTWFKSNVIDPLSGAFNAVAGAVQWLIDQVNAFKTAIANVQLPWWLQPGSPTPFELGLRGINDALKVAAQQGLSEFSIALDDLGPIIKNIVELFRQLSEYFADPKLGLAGAKATAETIAAIFDNLSTMIAGLQTLAAVGDLSAVAANLDAVLAIMRVTLPALVDAFRGTFKLFTADALAAAVALAETAGKLVAPLQAMADGFAAVAGWVSVSLEPILGGFMLNLRKLARQWIAAGALFDAEMLAGALYFASIAESLVAPLRAMVDGFTAVATWLPRNLEPLFAGMLSQLRRLANLWKAAASTFDAEILAGALWFAGVANTLVAPLKAMVDGFTAVATWVTRNLELLFAGMLSQLRRLANLWKAAASGFDAEMLAGALYFAGVAGTLVAPLKAMVDAFATAATYVPQNLQKAINGLLNDLAQVALAFVAAAAGFEAAGLAAAAAFAQAGGTIAGQLKAMVDGLTAVATYVPAQLGKAVSGLVADLVTVVIAFVAAAKEFEKDGLAAAMAFAQAGGTIAGQLQAMVDGFTAVSDYVPQELKAAIIALVADLKTVVVTFVAAARNFDSVGLAAASGFAQAGGAIAGQLKAMVDGFTAVSSYVPKELKGAIKALVADLRTVVVTFVAAAKEFEKDGLATAMAFAQAGGTIAGQLQAMVDGFASVADYVSASGLAQALARFVTDAQEMVRLLAVAATEFDADALAATQAFAAVIGTVGDGIGSAVTGLRDVLYYMPVPTTQIDAFVYNLRTVIARLAEASATFTEAELGPVRSFASTAQAVGDMISGAMGALSATTAEGDPTALAGYTSAASMTALVISDMLSTMLQVRAVATTLTPTDLNNIERFAEIGGSVWRALDEGVRSAGSIVIQAADFTGLAAGVQLMVGVLTATLPQMASRFADLVQAAWNFGHDWVMAIHDGLESHLGDLEELMAYIRGLFPSSPAQYGAWRRLPDGGGVGASFVDDMANSLRNVAAVQGGLDALHALFGGTLASPQPIFAPAGGGGLINNITISGNSFSSREDVDYLLDELDRRMAVRGWIRPM